MLAQRDDDLTDSSRELSELDPYYSPKGELRAQGQLKYLKKLGVETSRPLIMKGKSEWTHTLIRHIHETTKHMAGTEQVLAELRKCFWITKGCKAIHKVLRECVKCRRLHKHTVTQQMGPISDIRVPDKASYAFQYTAVDAAGPFYTKMPRGHTRHKRYLLVFTCCTFRCTHLEMLTALDTESFLLAFEQFLARRGRPTVLAMDNGMNFVGGASDLVRSWQDLQTDAIQKKYDITFKFNVPLAPHRSGLVERIVGSAKRALLHIIKPEVAVTDEELTTAFAMVEAVLNVRPLTYVGSDFKDLEPLTPEHFLKQVTLWPWVSLACRHQLICTVSLAESGASEKSCNISLFAFRKSMYLACNLVRNGKDKLTISRWEPSLPYLIPTRQSTGHLQ